MFEMELSELGDYGKKGAFVSEARITSDVPVKRLLRHEVVCVERKNERVR